jgi:hypothetical protein
MIIGTDQASCLGTAEGVLATDLLWGADDLATQLRRALRGEQWLDAYLLAAGLGQLVEDRLHADPLLLNRAASYYTAAIARGPPGRERPRPPPVRR